MKRVVAILLAILGGAVAAYATIVSIAGVMFGALWLWVFGDDLWPRWATMGFDILIPAGGLVLWALFAWLIWRRLRREFSSG